MIERHISDKILRYAKQYPVVTITGPRQSGKTTLCRMLFPDKKYFSLEDLDTRADIQRDPRSFLEQSFKTGAIIDEVQRYPDLLSYIQGYVDAHDKPGRFILTGSQNFQLLNSVSQSLAGRTALATLLPLSYDELSSKRKLSLEDILFSGFYPRIHDKNLHPTEILSFYVGTYLERDIRSLIHVKDLSQFETFLKICAARTGQILNLSSIANDCGVAHNTVKSWLSILEASYLIYLVRPHHQNFKKRLIKAPKLYFTDVGLAAYLLGISETGQLDNHPLKGALFETFVIGELLKYQWNHLARPANVYYFRDNVGHEVDALIEHGTKIFPVEIKLGKTVSDDFFKGLEFYSKLNVKNAGKGFVVYGGNKSAESSRNDIVSYQSLHEYLKKVIK